MQAYSTPGVPSGVAVELEPPAGAGVNEEMAVKLGMGVMEGKGVVVTVGVFSVVGVKEGAAVKVWTIPVMARSGVALGGSSVAAGAGSAGLHAETASTAANVIHMDVLILACTV